MNANIEGQLSIRLAVLTESISHFEVPLFRLCAKENRLEFNVFYLKPAKSQRYDSEYLQNIDWGCDLLSGYAAEQVSSAGKLGKAAEQWGAQVVMLYGYGWAGAARLITKNWWRGMPQIHRGTLNYHFDPRRPIRGRLMRPLRRLLLRLFQAHHFGGDYSRKVLMDAGIDKSAMFFVPYSVDTGYFLSASENPENRRAAGKIRASLGWKADDHVLLFIAQHNWFKGPDIALKVFREVLSSDPKTRLLIVGSGRMTESMKDYAHKLLDPSVIHFAGFVPSTQSVPYYLASDLVICVSRYETWARMVNEAMLCRKPCIINRIVPAAGGLVKHGETGFVVDAPNPHHYVPEIQRYFAKSREEREHMGDAACSKAQVFAYDRYLDNVVAAAKHAITKTNSNRKKSKE
jgi:glycosyltransferase involved in cell wall biosynthesis